MRNWADVLPEDVALRQAQWERRRTIARMYDVGMTMGSIAEKMQTGRANVNRIINVMKSPRNKISPAERYLAQPLEDDLKEWRMWLGKYWTRDVERTYGIRLP